MVGQHRQAGSTRRMLVISSLGLILVVVAGVGVQAAIRAQDDTPSRPGATESRNGGDRPRGDEARTPQPAPKETFPGRPEKRTGVEKASGLQSGLGDEADDLAQEAQGLIDGEDEKPAPAPLEFRLSSFNVLGAGHTGPRGNKPDWADYGPRLTTQLRLLNSNDVDVVGFQEFEPPQYQSFMRRTGGAWGVYPAMSKGRPAVRNSIAWRRDVWDLADYTTLPVPYFRGNIVPMPVILLTHRQTGRQVYLINVHNPASSSRRGNNEPWRDEAARRQLAKVRQLRDSAPTVPVILMGDFNERLEVYCKATAGGDMQAANPGDDTGRCSPPALMGIDWIFGTSDLVFTDYRRVATRSSDHPMLVVSAGSQ